jgi:hypothetical protein
MQDENSRLKQLAAKLSSHAAFMLSLLRSE